jgi:hypothetical protein
MTDSRVRYIQHEFVFYTSGFDVTRNTRQSFCHSFTPRTQNVRRSTVHRGGWSGGWQPPLACRVLEQQEEKEGGGRCDGSDEESLLAKK